MLVDIMSPYSFLSVSVKMINMFGTSMAIYWAELLNIYPRVIHKKFEELQNDNGYFTVDREYVQSRTGLSLEEQYANDQAFVRLGVLAVHPDCPNKIAIALNTMLEILAEDDAKQIKSLQKTARIKVKDTSTGKILALINNYCAKLQAKTPQLQAAYCDWIESICTNKKPLSNPAIKQFQADIDAYTDDERIQLEIIKLATSACYTVASWAISSWERDHKKTPATFIGVSQKASVGISDTAF